MTKTKTYARYAQSGLGYQVWEPGSDTAGFWFSTIEQVHEFALACGWDKIKRI